MNRIKGTVRVDTRTKRLIQRLHPGEIAVISHRDIDGPCAQALIKRGAAAVINAEPSITGRIPNLGPQILLSAGVPLIDSAGPAVMQELVEGDYVEIVGDTVYRNGTLVGAGQALSREAVQTKLIEAQRNLDGLLRSFVRNTLRYLELEQGLLFEPSQIPTLNTDFSNRHALMVVRGERAAEDLEIIAPYIRDMQPVLVGVDGGADVLLEAGYRPDIIIGDMDSVSDRALRCGAELVAHAYLPAADAEPVSPGLARLKSIGLEAHLFPSVGMSEDVALLLAYEKGADLIVAVGAHSSMEEFLERAREGMSSTFLTRLKVGAILVDAKGVSRLYRPAPPATYMLGIVGVAAVTLALILTFAPEVRANLQALAVKISLLLRG